MDERTFICSEHSGCMARVERLEKENNDQWDRLAKTDERMDSIFTRLNIVLGGIIVACIMLAINLALKQ